MTQSNAYKKLWVAVIIQAVTDLKSGCAVERSKAKTWLKQTDGRFVEICDYLGVCPIRIRKEVFNEKTKHKSV